MCKVNSGDMFGASQAFDRGEGAERKARLPEDVRADAEGLDAARGREEEFHDDFLDGNFIIEEAIDRFHARQSVGNLIAVLEAIRRRMREDGHFMIPVIPPQAAIDMLDIEHLRVGDTVVSEEELHFKLHHIQTRDGRLWLAAFTSRTEYEKGERTSIISNFIDGFLSGCRDMDEAGVIINPWGKPFLLAKELIGLILDADKR